MKVVGSLLLAESAPEVGEFDERLRRDLPQHLYESVLSWVSEAGIGLTVPLWNVIGQRCDEHEALAAQAEREESEEQGRARVRRYFETVNPGPIAGDMVAAARLPDFMAHYRQSVGRLAEDAVIGPIVRRYIVPDAVLRRLCTSCVEPLQTCQTTLEGLGRAIRAHVGLLRSLRNKQTIKTGVGVAAAIAGGLLLGPLGLAAGAVVAGISDPTAKISQSAGRVEDAFHRFRDDFVTAVEQVDANVQAVYLSLYGGLVLRVEEDLAALGRTLKWLNLEAGTAEVGLSEYESERYAEWASSTLAGLHDLSQKGEWLTALIIVPPTRLRLAASWFGKPLDCGPVAPRWPRPVEQVWAER